MMNSFPCFICGKHIKGRSNLNTHLKSIHTSHKYSCFVCNTSFAKKSTLDTHNKSQKHRLKEEITSFGNKKMRVDVEWFNVPIIGDGNCLFRTVSKLFFMTEGHHRVLRDISTRYIQKMSERFKEAPADASEDGVWCGVEHVVALTELFDAPLITVEKTMSPLNSNQVRLTQQYNTLPLYLQFHRKRQHYEAKLYHEQAAFFSSERVPEYVLGRVVPESFRKEVKKIIQDAHSNVVYTHVFEIE